MRFEAVVVMNLSVGVVVWYAQKKFKLMMD